jgi:outer membrane protein assembly factor BamA
MSALARNLLTAAIAVSLLISASFAQTKPDPHAAGSSAPTFVLKKVICSGSKRFPETDIIKSTGLKLGSRVTADELQQAAARLGQSGVFSQVSYRFDGESATFSLMDAEQLAPSTFENFVWFPDADLVQRVHDSVPLFNGSVPLSGNLADQVSAALDSILKQKGIQGHTASMMAGKLAGQLQAVQYRIDGVSVKIAEIRFPGADPSRVPLLMEAIKKPAGEDFQETFFAGAVKLNGSPVYGKLGFLRAQFGVPKAVILKDDVAQPSVAVEVPVQEGDQYTFQSANWSGVNAVPIAELSKTIDLKVGAPADTTHLANNLAAAKELYGTKGYMNAQVKSTATLDNEKRTAVFNLEVSEGPLYRMGQLEVHGPDSERAELVRKVWEMREGDVYDSSYVKTFLKKHPKDLASLAGWAIHFTQTIHDDTHVVDLSLKFEKFQPEAR